MKKLVSLFLCLCMAFALVACEAAQQPATEAAPAVEAAAPAAEQKELLIATGSEAATMDCVAETNDDSQLVMVGSVWEKLVAADAEDNIICELAESFDVSEDAKEWTYHLRKGIKFHNGKEMKAEDVVSSMNRWLDFAGTADNMVGGARFEEVDEYTVTIKMEKGTAYLNNLIANFGQAAIITTKECNEEAAASDDGLLHTFIGTGPYKWGEWKSAEYIKLLAYEDYQPYGTPGDYSGWAGYKRAWYDSVKICFVSDENTLNAGMLTGEYKATTSLEMAGYYDTYHDNPDFVQEIYATDLNNVIFNKKEGWGANPKFRQAVQALINCDDVLYAYWGNEDFYKLYSSYMFEGTIWYTEAGSQYYNQANKERALELFAEAGFTADDTFVILCASDSADYYTYAQIIQSEFAEVGLKCDIMAYEWGTFTQIRNNEPDKYNAFLTSFSPKVLPNLNLFLSATWAGWCTDERIQNDLAAISSATDLDAAIQCWNDLQLYMYEEAVPVAKLGCSATQLIYASDMTGFTYKERIVWVDGHEA